MVLSRLVRSARYRAWVWACLCVAMPFLAQAQATPQWRALVQTHAEQQAPPSGVRIVLNYPSDEDAPPAVCRSGLQVTGPTPSAWRGRVRVQLQCQQPAWRWAVLVHVQRMGFVVQTQRSVPSGTVLQRGDLDLLEVDLALEPEGVATRPDQVLGRETTRPLRESSSIVLNNLRAATVIRKGERVVVRVLGSTFEVLSDGVAQQNGGAGDAIRIKMADGKLITGEVVSSGEVAIRL